MNTEPQYSKILNLNNVICDPDHIKPIFFKTYYPTRIQNYTNEEFENYKYIKGLKYIDQPKFVKDSKQNNDYKNYFYDNYQDYLDTLKSFINYQEYPFVLCGIPSSTSGKINMITKIIKDLVKEDPLTFIDGSNLMKRVASKQTAHETSENRSYKKDMAGLSREPSSISMEGKKIIVIDDVITSGSSFTAAYSFLTQFDDINPNQLIFFAFGKTVKNILLQPQIKKYDTFIFDIDQTIVNSQNNFDIVSAQDEYGSICANNESTPEEKSKAKSKLNSIITSNISTLLFKEIEELFNAILQTNSKIFFITNNNSLISLLYLEKLSNKLFGTKWPIGREVNYTTIQDSKLYLNDNLNMQNIGNLKVKSFHGHNYLNCNFNNLISAGKCKKNYNNKQYLITKPSPAPINKLIRDYNLNPNTTIGIGNSISDMISYKSAGITAALAEWGNRGATTIPMEKIADICLESPLSLKDYILQNPIPSTSNYKNTFDNSNPFNFDNSNPFNIIK